MVVICQACQLVAPFVLGPEQEFVFQCPKCKKIIKGTAEDHKISEGTIKAKTISDKNAIMLSNAAQDPTNLMIARDCPKCGLDYATVVVIGKEKKTSVSCKCGHIYQ